MRLHRFASSLALGLLLGSLGCTSDDVARQADDITELSGYEMDLAKANAIYPGEPAIAKPSDAWTARVVVGGKTIPAPTHLFGEVVNVIPYANQDDVTTADGTKLARGDEIIARYFKPGQLGIGLKMHRPEKRLVDLDSADASSMKEDFKLQDTHIEIVVGVERAEHGHKGAITLNNPQTYEQGRFGNETYSMIFLRPELPAFAGAAKTAYFDNARLALVGFNAVTDFPGDYNGGDPLGARNPDKVREYVDQMVRAIAGDEAARAWFHEPENKVYCAELAFLSLSAGIIQPINARTLVPRVGQETWDKFAAEVQKHNRGVDEIAAGGQPSEPSAFVTLNGNKRVAMVRIALAPDELAPLATLAPDPAAAAEQLALRPMTMSDIVEEFMRTHLPREILGEALAPVQGAVLAKMKPGLLESMAMNQLPETDPRRAAVEALFGKIVEVVGTPHANYAAFRVAIEPLLEKARNITGPRDGTGKGLFTPPSLFHVVAQGKHLGGLVTMQYEGHGVHASAVVKTAAPPPAPIDHDVLPQAGTCDQRCGGFDHAASCQCDGACTQYGDCCIDYASTCGG
jgi:hypothetical protein